MLSRKQIKEYDEAYGKLPSMQRRQKVKSAAAELKMLEPKIQKQNATEEELTRANEIMDFLEWADMPAEEPLSHIESRNGGFELSTGPFHTFAEQLLACREASREGGRVDPRLHEVRAASGLSEGIPSDGGFLVQIDFANQLIENIYETGKLVGRCRKISVSRNANAISIPGVDEASRADGSRQGGIRVYNIEEAAEKTKSKPKFRKVNLQLSKKVGLCYASDELLEDSALLEDYVKTGFAREFGFKLDNEILNGSGANGEFLGIKNANALVTVAKETGQANDTVIAANIFKMYSRFNGDLSRAVWLCHRNVLPQLYQMSIAVGTGGVPVYQPANQLAGRPYQSLMGLPLLAGIEQCQTLGDKGDIYLVDLSKYIIAEKGPIQSAVSIHVRFIYDETVFRFVYRCAGQPEYSTAITPFKGSDTESPFITLAAR